jgi:hypothetical protein
MQNRLINILAVLILPWLALTGCYKDETKYFSDPENNGVAIFSNTGNNIFTCYVNGEPWRTQNRTIGGPLGGSQTEVSLSKQSDSSFQVQLVIQWYGFFQDSIFDLGWVYLYINVPANFTNRDIGGLRGKRLVIDSASGHFLAYMGALGNNNYELGTGSIYFNRASYNYTAAGSFSGSLSGLLEADFPDFKITDGRFDHQLTPLQVDF